MDFHNENIKEEDIGTTENGFRYVDMETSNGIVKLRESHRPDRITEDGETYEEYKTRRDVINSYINNRKKGQVIWPSHMLGTLTLEKAQELKEHFDHERDS